MNIFKFAWSLVGVVLEATLNQGLINDHRERPQWSESGQCPVRAFGIWNPLPQRVL